MLFPYRTSATSATFAALVAAGFLVGCGASQPMPNVAAPSAAGAAYRLAAEPAGAKGVKEIRADAKDEEEITLVGRIGGDPNPWVEGQAAFVVMDSVLKPCDADEGCPTPWDCCCDPNLSPETKALVKVVGEDGKPLAVDARKLLGLKELQTVVVHGRAKRDEAGNLTVLADGVFVRN
ncbi:MAG: hypothetical protein WD872_19860 [Pirellulaceae bacterium]